MVIMASATTTAVTDATEVGADIIIILEECGSCMVVVDGSIVHTMCRLLPLFLLCGYLTKATKVCPAHVWFVEGFRLFDLALLPTI